MLARRVSLALAAAICVVFAPTVAMQAADEDSGDQRLVVVSLNTWHAGRGILSGPDKIRRFLVEEAADLVALQETEGVLARQLAASLGWWCVQSSGSVAILSRHPILDELRLHGVMESKAIGARIAVSGRT